MPVPSQIILALMALALPVWSHSASPSQLLGTWEVGENWEAEIVIGPDRISLGGKDCQDLPYKLLNQIPQTNGVEVYVLDIAAPPDKCRSHSQKKVIWHFRIKRGGDQTYMNYYICPSVEDLELLMQGKNRYCAGSFFARKRR